MPSLLKDLQVALAPAYIVERESTDR